jgi:ketosteroid isomerase-like protein
MGREDSPERTELARSAFDALARRDLDAYLALMHEEVHTDSRLAPMEGGFVGHEGVRRWWRAVFEVFPDYSVEVCELRHEGEVTLTRVHTRGRAADSQAPLVETLWVATRWREDKVVWWSAFPTEDEARTAAAERRRAEAAS